MKYWVRQSGMMRGLAAMVASAVALCAAAGDVGGGDAAQESQLLSFSYETEIGPLPSGVGPVEIFLPLPANTAQQKVLSEKILSPLPGSVQIESVYGNRYWHGTMVEAGPEPVVITMEFTVARLPSRVTPAFGERPLSDAEKAEMQRYLQPNSRVLVDHPILLPIRQELSASVPAGQPSQMARAIYDWVVDNMEYKKVGSGWGNGDTFWACSERYGNCTDFHALFISLARSEGIPARFEIGFPVPTDRESGQIGGYHCWVQYYLPASGWFPIDASEAFKDPSLRDYYYGSHPGDRIHFSSGRDLRLGPRHRGEPLNYFIYPYVEVDGVAWKGDISKRFGYTRLSQSIPGGVALPHP